MQPQDDGAPNKCRRRFQQKFLSICALTVLVWLVFYGFALTDIKLKASDQFVDSWNISLLVQNAVSQLHTAIILPKIQRKRKLVLLWTSYFSLSSDWLPTTKDLECPVTECDATSNRSMLNQSSAVVFHWRNVDVQDLPTCAPSENVQCPLWVLFNEEAPPHTNRDTLETIQDKMHWTATYRQDSEVFAPYGKVIPRRNNTYTKIDFNPDRRLVCWLVSNCNTPSKREVYVNELKKYVEIDIYGKCGNAECPLKLVKECYQWLSKRCKFYLSFENSNCRDYTTEKLYYALSSNMVPVVLGISRNYRHLPSRSYINAADFASPKELANYLVAVGNDKNTYLSYFWWTKYYEVIDNGYMWFCDFCAKLHETDVGSVKHRKNLSTWWFDQSECMSGEKL